MKVVNFVFNAAGQQSYRVDEDSILFGAVSYLELALVSSDAGLTIAAFTDQTLSRVSDDNFSFLLYIPNGTQLLVPRLMNLSFVLDRLSTFYVTSASAGLVAVFLKTSADSVQLGI